MFGMVISSSSPAVAARCVHLRARAGVIGSQNITDPALGQIGLDLLARGLSAREACAALVASTPFIAYRQLTLVDASGDVASYSGSNTLGVHAVHSGEGVIAAGNLLANDQVRGSKCHSALQPALWLIARPKMACQTTAMRGPVCSIWCTRCLC